MSLEMWITYIFATTLILIIPGPTIILVISQAVTNGRKSVAPLVAGVILGDFTATEICNGGGLQFLTSIYRGPVIHEQV